MLFVTLSLLPVLTVRSEYYILMDIEQKNDKKKLVHDIKYKITKRILMSRNQIGTLNLKMRHSEVFASEKV